MEFQWILIRYGEIGLKSDYVRRSFEDRLMNNIRQGLEDIGIDGKVQRGYGRIFVNTKEVKKASEVLRRTFGVVSFSLCQKMEAGFEGVVKKLEEMGREYIDEDDSFAVRVRRTGDHEFSSKDIEEEAGERILKATGADVDLDNPDEMVMADIRQGQAYIFRGKIEGPGGLPLGTQGKVVSLFDGGCRSFLATWLMMKRGCSVVLLHGEMEPYAVEESFEEALEELKGWSHGSPVNVLEFDHGGKLFEITEEGQRGYNCALCKRLLYRLADRTAEETGAKAIVTGETLDEDLERIGVLESDIKNPVVRPLVGFDDNEIRGKCRDIAGDFLLEGKGCEAEDKERSDLDEEKIRKLEKEIDIDELVEKIMEEVEL